MITRHQLRSILLTLIMLNLLILSPIKAGMLSLKTLDHTKKKVGVLSLSAIKLWPLLHARYTMQDIDPKENEKLAEFLTNAGYIADNYRQWLSEADVQTVPILFFKSTKELLDLMDHLDGFVLTGGSEGFFEYESAASRYIEVVTAIIKKAKDINDFGRPFPIWGTCLGFEAMLLTESNLTLKRHVVDNHLKLRERIKIMDDNLESMKYFTEKELSEMEDVPILYFNHMFGISRNDVRHLPELKDKVRIGAKINTVRRRNVAAWMEFRDYPFFGTQFHPEKRPIAGANPFDQTPKYHSIPEASNEQKDPTATEGSDSSQSNQESNRPSIKKSAESSRENLNNKNQDKSDNPESTNLENHDDNEMEDSSMLSSPEALDLGEYLKISDQQNAFFNSYMDPLESSTDSEDSDNNLNSKNSKNSKSGDDAFEDGENNNDARSEESEDSEHFDQGKFDPPTPIVNNKDFDFDDVPQEFPAGSTQMEGVHVAVEHATALPNNSAESGGVDSAGIAVVIDPQQISKKYLKLVRKINHKFAKFFAHKIKAAKLKLPEKFLKKQIYWVKNIGSYYEVNLFKDNM